MIKMVCDACDTDITENHGNMHERIEITLCFYSWWNSAGDKREIILCMRCGVKLINNMGFCHDTGRLLSSSRGEYVTSVDVRYRTPDLAAVNPTKATMKISRPDAPLVKIEERRGKI